MASRQPSTSSRRRLARPSHLFSGSARLRGGFAPARLPVGAGEDDLAMEGLQRPAAGDEAGGQVVEQVRVRRRLAELAEVARGRHQRSAEVPAPDPVDDDPPGEGRRIPDDPVGKLFPTAPLSESPGLAGREDGREPPRDDRAGVRGVPSEEDGEVARDPRAVVEHRPGRVLAVDPEAGIADGGRRGAVEEPGRLQGLDPGFQVGDRSVVLRPVLLLLARGRLHLLGVAEP